MVCKKKKIIIVKRGNEARTCYKIIFSIAPLLVQKKVKYILSLHNMTFGSSFVKNCLLVSFLCWSWSHYWEHWGNAGHEAEQHPPHGAI